MLIWYMIFHHGLISIPPWSRIWSGESQYGFGSVLAFKALCVLLVPRCSGEDQAIASWDFWKLYVHHPSNLYKYGIKGFNPESWDWTLQNSWTYIVCLHLQEKKTRIIPTRHNKPPVCQLRIEPGLGSVPLFFWHRGSNGRPGYLQHHAGGPFVESPQWSRTGQIWRSVAVYSLEGYCWQMVWITDIDWKSIYVLISSPVRTIWDNPVGFLYIQWTFLDVFFLFYGSYTLKVKVHCIVTGMLWYIPTPTTQFRNPLLSWIIKTAGWRSRLMDGSHGSIRGFVITNLPVDQLIMIFSYIFSIKETPVVV